MTKLIVERKNTHMEHLEDLILNDGVGGARTAINYLQGVRDMLAGHSNKKFNMTVKWDGAPAVFAGIDPSDGKFFVAKKGIFNKNPKVYKSEADVDADTSGDLAKKLKMAFRYLQDVGITDVVQGDILFTNDTVKTAMIDGERHYTFHPNTIMYTVPAASKLGKKINRAKIGIVWHTLYKGRSFETMKAHFGVPIADHLKHPTTVWQTDATFRDVSGVASFTDKETAYITKILSNAGRLFNKIPAAALNDLSKNEEFLIRLKVYNNQHIREGNRITNVPQYVNGLINYFTDYYKKQIDAKKTARGKATWREKKKEAMAYFTRHSKRDLINIFHLYNLIVDAKHFAMSKLNQVKTLRTFLRTKDGLKPTTPEGYVAIDHVGNAIKLVDRLEFSYANFSDHIIKGWMK